jgi:hypothetical protein
MKLSFFLCYSFYWFVWPLWYCEQFDAGARQMENFDFARKVFFIFDFNAFKFDLWFYDWIWGHSTASNQLQL